MLTLSAQSFRSSVPSPRKKHIQCFVEVNKKPPAGGFFVPEIPRSDRERGTLILFGSQGDDGILVCRNAGWDKSGNDSQQQLIAISAMAASGGSTAFIE